jgi:8-oxo-dGTP diphosphatase
MPEDPSLDEKTFLQDYRKEQYPRPSVTVDLAMFTVVDTDLKVLLIKRAGHPYQGCWALPGGFLDVGDAFENQGEDLDDAAFRELGEETGLDRNVLLQNRVHLEQLYTFGDANRDPRTRVVTVAYFALVPPQLVPLVRAGSDAAEARWFSVRSEIEPSIAQWYDGVDGDLAFDHAKILRVAIERVRGKFDYTPIAFSLVPLTFTVAEMRAVYEAVKGATFDLGNFRRRFNRMVADGLIEEAPGKRVSRSGPAAKVYRFRN